jgi:rhamnulokinase
MSCFLAFDLGAESGRAVLGHLEDGRLRLEEVHRFPNGPVQVLDRLHWDVLRLWSEIKHGLELAAHACGPRLAGLGVDTWGVDFGLLAADDTLLGNPYHYRDRATDGMLEAAFEVVPRAEIYERTGLQFMQLNSLYQLLAMARAGSPLLAGARTFLNMPDLLNVWLSGRKASEFTIASTSQCYDPRAGDWARDLLQRLDIPTHLFGPIVPPGTILDTLRPSVSEETGCPAIPVVASAGHDTACAVAAVPATGGDYIYLSSGTWSLMGIESPAPIINARSLAYNLTNEGGVGRTFRFLKNIMGLWLVQECRREWKRQGESLSYDDVAHMAAQAPAFGPLVALDGSRFLAPGDMPRRIVAYWRETGQVLPGAEELAQGEVRGAIVRCVLESLALEYRRVAEQLDELVGRRLPTIHIIGGGSQNRLLNQLTADATGRTVVAGPVEATSLGNILVQALALGHITSLSEGRSLIRRSCDVTTFEPRAADGWDEAYTRYLKLKG